MSDTAVTLTLKKGRSVARIDGTRVTFSPHQCFRFDGSAEELECVRALGAHLLTLPDLALVGAGRFADYLLEHNPGLKGRCIVHPDPAEALPPEVKSAFLCELRMVPRMQLRKRLPRHVRVVEPTVLAEIAPESIPARGWVPTPSNIYPIELPEIRFEKGKDLILVDCPSRNLALMPNGLAYVHNALKKTSVSYQIFDLDIVAYHRFHMHRLYDMGGRIVLPSGRVLPEDPWQAEHYDVWSSIGRVAPGKEQNEVLEFFQPLIDEAVNGLVEARPKILGLSIQQCNEAISREIVRGVRARLPEVVVLVGGFSCYQADIGFKAFPDCDYMCIGESDLTVGPLVEALARGERPKDQPGVLARIDTPNRRFIPAPMPHNLDHIEFPKYEWCDLNLYRNWNGYQLTPIIASRGCRWSRCTFCAERFYWRIRSPENFVDELQWLVNQGCHLFMFNESDLNGMPERVMEICDEIIRRGLHRKVKLTGQLRIHKKSDKAFFEKLRQANFVALRFGVDAFSANTLRLQKKGYTTQMLSQNLKDCWESGIYTEVNWVIGVPGETDADVQEGIELILANRKYIGRLANINPLIMVNGSVYWLDPESHGIVFRQPREELYAKFPRAMPADVWYSTEPYIDAQVRKERFERIVFSLHEAGFPIGAWANRIIDDVKLARDPNRAGRKPQAAAAGEVPAKKAEARKVIPIQAAEAKPAAEPPLHGVAGQPPRIVREMDTHTLIAYEGWYYGVPRALGEVDLSNPDPAKMAGVIKHASEEAVIAVIEEASRWANTRGQYDNQEKQRAAGSYMRADSALGETRTEAVPEKPRIVSFRNEYFAVDERVLGESFTRFRQVDPKLAGEPAEGQSAEMTAPRSPLRRLAMRLSPALRLEVRRLIRLQSFAAEQGGGPIATQSDGRLISLLCKGAMNAYVKRPLLRLLHGSRSNGRSSVRVGGRDVHILSIVSKDALPELLWSMNGYNLVRFDGLFYGLPQGLPVDWESGELADTPGVVVGRTVKDVLAEVEQLAHRSTETLASASRATGPAGVSERAPKRLGTLEGYTIVSYEGWVYGLPGNLAHVDLTEVDVMELPGVIRDVSRDVVENEILDHVRSRQAAA